MTFDAWQLLVYFGTKPLDENERVFRSSDPIAQQAIDAGRHVYSIVAPLLYSAYDRNFYFQPVLIECELANYVEQLAREPSLFSINGISGIKLLKDLEGNDYPLPFFPFHILVNRALFGPQRQREDELTWLHNLTERRRAIAHELLFAKQYWQYYDVGTDTLVQNVSTPLTSEEDELMCPTEIIEKTLNFFETEEGIHLLTAGSFVDADPRFIRKYNYFWLREYAVSERVCNEQTENYLQIGVRNHIRSNAAEFSERISRIINHPAPNSTHFHQHLQNGSPFAVALHQLCRELATEFGVSHATVVVIVARALDLTNGAGI